VISRLFETKEKLYEAIVESQFVAYEYSFLSDLAAKKDDYGVFYSIAKSILLKGENTTLYRLLMYSVLEEVKLGDIYLKTTKVPIKDFINYIQQRTEDNAFKQMNSRLVASTFVGTCGSLISFERGCWRSPVVWMKYPQPLPSFFNRAPKVSPSEVEAVRHRTGVGNRGQGRTKYETTRVDS